jgi:hypothetical protein
VGIWRSVNRYALLCKATPLNFFQRANALSLKEQREGAKDGLTEESHPFLKGQKQAKGD